MSKSKLSWQLTVEEFKDVLREENSILIINLTKNKDDYVYGLDGLAKILGCSKNHAGKLKRSGIFDDAIIQDKRLIIIDKKKALKLFNDYNKPT